MESKDRTGYVCALLEGLCGASYEEMAADYLTTYANYYQVTSENAPRHLPIIAVVETQPLPDVLRRPQRRVATARYRLLESLLRLPALARHGQRPALRPALGPHHRAALTPCVNNPRNRLRSGKKVR